MTGYSKWVSKQRGNPIWLAATVIGFTVTFWGGFKYIYSPWAARNRLRQAEEFANFLIRKEEEEKELK